jgi:hypothetical protein
LRITKVAGKDVSDTKETQVSVKGEMFLWPTWTMIIGGGLIVIAITGVLIWTLFKKDGDEE